MELTKRDFGVSILKKFGFCGHFPPCKKRNSGLQKGTGIRDCFCTAVLCSSSIQRGRGHSPHPDLQCRTAEAAGSVQQEASRPLPLGKILRPGRRDLCAGQVQTVYPAASTVQRGTQTESQRERKANRGQEPDGIM